MAISDWLDAIKEAFRTAWSQRTLSPNKHDSESVMEKYPKMIHTTLVCKNLGIGALPYWWFAEFGG